jgi:hypothetical protein
MSSSINTAWPSLNRGVLAGLLIAAGLVGICVAQARELRAPATVVAGSSISIATTGSGSATFYLAGPGVLSRREVSLGRDIQLSSRELQNAGRYLAILCAGSSCTKAQFFVTPGPPASLTFLVHPSRAPVAENDVLSGVALPFDQFRNLVLEPVSVDFRLTAGNTTVMTNQASTHDGVAWFRTNSGKSSGALQVNASIVDPRSNSTSSAFARRVVQEVAADPCNLRIKGQRTAKGIVVETDPVRDCSGNPVPDGTIVTFTAREGDEKSTVDAPLKQGVARAQITATGPVVVSAASGVVMGNELRLGSQ